MARLPTVEELGALPSALSGRPIAKHDVSGYARGAAAIAEGVGALGRGIGRAADGIEEMRHREERARLDRAKADASYLVATKQLRTQLAQESDPDAVAQAYPEAFHNAYASAADLIGDLEAREEWGLSRSADRDGQIAASADQAETLRRGQEVEGVKTQLDTLRMAALDSGDDESRLQMMQAGQRLMFGLRDNGLIDDAGVKAMREHWATVYARERLGRMTQDERIKALEQGDGGIAELLPEDARADLLRNTRAELAEAVRKADSDAALARFVIDRDIADDLARVEASGRGNDELTPQRIDEALGSEARRAWQETRDDAFTVWRSTHDLWALADTEISTRIDALEPKDDTESRQRAIFDTVSRRAEMVRQLRSTDPAGSVAEDPNVRAAAGELDPRKPETMQRLIGARLAAQERAGLPPEALSPITHEEAIRLTAPLARAPRPGDDLAVPAVVGDFKAQFGAYANDALAYALKAQGLDPENADIAAFVLTAVDMDELRRSTARPGVAPTAEKSQTTGTGESDAFAQRWPGFVDRWRDEKQEGEFAKAADGWNVTRQLAEMDTRKDQRFKEREDRILTFNPDRLLFFFDRREAPEGNAPEFAERVRLSALNTLNSTSLGFGLFVERMKTLVETPDPPDTHPSIKAANDRIREYYPRYLRDMDRYTRLRPAETAAEHLAGWVGTAQGLAANLPEWVVLKRGAGPVAAFAFGKLKPVLKRALPWTRELFSD